MNTLQEYMQDDLCKKEISAGLFLQLGSLILLQIKNSI